MAPNTPTAIDAARREQLEKLWLQLDLTPPLPLKGRELAQLNEALTHTSSGLHPHHEQLEFLGDAVLRLAATEFIASIYPQLPVGDRSSLRAQLVSDQWLAQLGETIGIEHWWRIGATASGDVAAHATLRAELSEALIGAIYAIGGLQPVQAWLTPYWQQTSAAVLADPHRGNSKSALQEWSQSQAQGLPAYDTREISRRHGDPRRFHCRVSLPDLLAEGWGGSRRQAEQEAARNALQHLQERPKGNTAPH
ncbi:Ribonuclease III [Synechococcus sp. WH 8101]|uniref:ribonuclease III family protein n=1 Tax=Synechococcus sp. WH 8101 TaxID=59932 RepID=UPI0010230408|nr:ribonuclease III domain-containing protein [Synechococcus sp. WH 8101]QBE67779.1 Ribonuclease III [Synechococcus sp. WH 8101]QNI43975.1 ribonuclease III [Synechococcus sp. WH 8101]